jgi:hypothetical protein
MGLFGAIKAFFRKKRTFQAYIIDETDGIELYRVKVENNTFTLKNGLLDDNPMTYIVDNGYVVTRKKDNIPCSFYHKNNPEPINIFHKRNVQMSSIAFKKLLDDKTIQELFSPEGIKKLDIVLIIVIVNLLVSVVLLLIQFKVIKLPGGG